MRLPRFRLRTLMIAVVIRNPTWKALAYRYENTRRSHSQVERRGGNSIGVGGRSMRVARLVARHKRGRRRGHWRPVPGGRLASLTLGPDQEVGEPSVVG
jgi:hypothetical protein